TASGADGFVTDPAPTDGCPLGLPSSTSGIGPGTIGWLVDSSPTGPYFESVAGVRLRAHTAPRSAPPFTGFPSAVAIPIGGEPTGEPAIVLAAYTDKSGHLVVRF